MLEIAMENHEQPEEQGILARRAHFHIPFDPGPKKNIWSCKQKKLFYHAWTRITQTWIGLRKGKTWRNLAWKSIKMNLIKWSKVAVFENSYHKKISSNSIGTMFLVWWNYWTNSQSCKSNKTQFSCVWTIASLFCLFQLFVCLVFGELICDPLRKEKELETFLQ